MQSDHQNREEKTERKETEREKTEAENLSTELVQWLKDICLEATTPFPSEKCCVEFTAFLKQKLLSNNPQAIYNPFLFVLAIRFVAKWMSCSVASGPHQARLLSVLLECLFPVFPDVTFRSVLASGNSHTCVVQTEDFDKHLRVVKEHNHRHQAWSLDLSTLTEIHAHLVLASSRRMDTKKEYGGMLMELLLFLSSVPPATSLSPTANASSFDPRLTFLHPVLSMQVNANSTRFLMEFLPLSFEHVFDEFHTFSFVKQRARELFWAVQCLHAHNLAHRDLKPDNVRFTSEGSLRLFDFDTVSNKSHEARTRPIGTLCCSPPEIWEADQNKKQPYDAFACDVFSMGCLIYGMFANATMPFAIEESSFNKKLMYTFCPSAKIRNRMGSFDVLQLLSQMLHIDPKQRPSMQELAQNPFFQ